MSTQRQALNALVFLYREVLDIPLEEKIAPVRSKKQARPPTVPTQEEIKRLLIHRIEEPIKYSQKLGKSMAKIVEVRRGQFQDCSYQEVRDFVSEPGSGLRVIGLKFEKNVVSARFNVGRFKNPFNPEP